MLIFLTALSSGPITLSSQLEQSSSVSLSWGSSGGGGWVLSSGSVNSTPSLVSACLNPLVVGDITAVVEPGSEVVKRMVIVVAQR